MKTLKIQRMEGIYAICADVEKKYYAIAQAELPAGAKEGDRLEISDEGELSLAPLSGGERL